MAAIDNYIGYLTKFKATAIILESGKQALVRLATGDRSTSAMVVLESLQALVEECAPADAWRQLLARGSTRFAYAGGPQPVTCTVETGPSRMRLVISAGIESAHDPVSPPRERKITYPGDVAVPSATVTAREPAIAPRSPAMSPPRAAVGQPYSAGATPVPVSVPYSAGSGPNAVAVPRSTSFTPVPVTEPPPMKEPRAQVLAGSGAEIDEMLRAMKKMGASDLHLSCSMPPLVRHDGGMKPIPGFAELGADHMLKLLYEICPARNRKEFEERSDTDFAYAIAGLSRFRCNLFQDRRGPGGVFRAIPFQLLTPEQLGLPQKVLDLCHLTKGLVVVTGPTGSGKSTTLSTLVDYVNMNRSDHIITIEDPIEFVHENKKCLVNQREVHIHTRSFKDALRAALREDPDIVLVGEMRDLETVAIAVETAETGHLVFGTLHTTTAPSTVDRIIDQFPTDRQAQIRQMLAESLRGVIAQTLCKKIGGGRIAAYEVLIGTSAVSNLIRQSKTFQLGSVMQTSRHIGMVTLNDSLLELVKARKVEPLEAYSAKAVNKSELKAAFAKLGIEVNLQEEKE